MLTRRAFLGAGLALLYMAKRPHHAHGLGGVLSTSAVPTFQATPGLSSSTSTFTEPTLPTLPAAGGKLIDPTFGTTILRVTDASNATSNDAEIRGAGVVYSYITALNANSTRLYVLTNPTGTYKRATFFTFNPVAFSAGASGTLLASALSNNVQEYWMLWHPTHPDLIYSLVNGGYGIYETNVASDTTTSIKALTGLGHTGGSAQQLSLSEDGDVFAGSFTGGSTDGWWVWKRSTNTMLKVVTNLTSGTLNEVQIDKSGRYLSALFSDKTCEVWNLAGTPTLIADRTALENATIGLAWSHYDSGYGKLFSRNWTDVVIRNLGARRLSTPTTMTALVNDGDWRYADQNDHFSWRSNVNGELWACASRYSLTGSGVSFPYDNEIVLIATDGSKAVRRVCHHRTVYVDSSDEPRASQSRDGKFIVFQSTWGVSGGRHDVFVVKVV